MMMVLLLMKMMLMMIATSNSAIRICVEGSVQKLSVTKLMSLTAKLRLKMSLLCCNSLSLSLHKFEFFHYFICVNERTVTEKPQRASKSSLSGYDIDFHINFLWLLCKAGR